MQSTAPLGSILITLAPMFILTSIPFAIGSAYLAPKMGRSPWLWPILFLIPFVNFVAMYVFFFIVAGAVLDRLNAIGDRMRDVTPFS